ncbi:MAG: polyprenyl synthetase family protein, partial [bacterium]|nr:polyprenyl synthetase family protein [bacterium]
MQQRLFEEIEKRVALVKEYVMRPEYLGRFHPEDMAEAVTCYFESGGKRLRPAVLLFCVGAVGGEERNAICAAAATEIFHTWTLVHDDIIDRDPTRRGAPTVHERFFRKPSTRALFGSEDESRHYGLSVAVLAGDVQHGWGISLMTELTRLYGLDPAVTLMLINTLDTRVLCTLVDGEMLDVQFSRTPIEHLSAEQIESMLWKKTGALYEFCGEAGACIGLNCPDIGHPLAAALGKFCSLCGTAFQIQDDILGIIGDEKLLGKSVGSDIREGKRTLIVRHAWERANRQQRTLLTETLGNAQASPERIGDVQQLFMELGSLV